jgi:thiol-disulfide isomerase/thioredoxin
MVVHEIKTSRDLDRFLKEHEVVVVYCGLTHCAPCKIVYPKFESLIDKYINISFCKITLDKLDEDECESYIREKLKLTKFPSFTLVNNGIILDHVIGPNINKVISILDCIGDTGDDEF